MMKKLLIILTFMITGTFGIFKADSNVMEEMSVCSSWITVTASCGVDFYLCADNYDSATDLIQSAIYFSTIRCEAL